MKTPHSSSTVSGIRLPLYYGWVMVVVVALLAFVGGTETHPVLGIFQSHMAADLGWSRSSFTWPISVGTALGGVLAIAVGPAMDRHGARWIMAGAALVLSADFLLMGLVTELWQYTVLQIAGRAALTSTFFVVGSVVIPKWFVAMRGRAIALSGMGQRAGHTSLPIFVERVSTLSHWRTAWFALAALVLALGFVPVVALFRRRPEDLGLRPDGAGEPEAALRSDARSSRALQRVRRSADREVSLRPRQAVRTRAFYLLLTAQAFQSLVIAGLHFHWFPYLTGNGLSSGTVVASIAVANIVSIPFALTTGFLVERVPVRYIIAAGQAGIAGAIVLLLFADSNIMAYAFAVVLGVVQGAGFTAGGIIWADYYGREHAGAIRGVISPVTTISNALGPLTAALAFDAFASYVVIFWLFAGLSAVAGVCLLLAAPPRAPEASGVPLPDPVGTRPLHP